jgi:hypothetical protein
MGSVIGSSFCDGDAAKFLKHGTRWLQTAIRPPEVLLLMMPLPLWLRWLSLPRSFLSAAPSGGRI